MPQNSKEVALSKYAAETFLYANYREDIFSQTETIEKIEDLIGKNILVNGEKMQISGIVDTNFDSERYKRLKEINRYDIDELQLEALKSELSNLLTASVHALCFVSNEYMNEISNVDNYFEARRFSGAIMHFSEINLYDRDNIGYIYKFKNDLQYCLREGQNTLGNNQCLLPIGEYMSIVSKSGSILQISGLSNEINQAINHAVDNYVSLSFSAAKVNGFEGSEAEYKEYLTEEFYINKYGESTYAQIIMPVVSNKFDEHNVYKNVNYRNDSLIIVNEKIGRISVVPAGFFIPEYSQDTKTTKEGVVFSETLYDTYINVYIEGKYNSLLTYLPHSRHKVYEITNFYLNFEQEEQTVFDIQHLFMAQLNNLKEITDILKQVFLFVGIFLMIFALLLMYNFRSISINDRQKDIGILRSLGASGGDVLTIFGIEGVLIALVNFLLAVLGMSILVMLTNYVFKNYYFYTYVTVIVISFRQILLLFFISFFAAFLGSFLQISKASRKKPAECISKRE